MHSLDRLEAKCEIETTPNGIRCFGQHLETPEGDTNSNVANCVKSSLIVNTREVGDFFELQTNCIGILHMLAATGICDIGSFIICEYRPDLNELLHSACLAGCWLSTARNPARFLGFLHAL